MANLKFLLTLLLAIMIFLSCSIVTGLKEKLNSKKEETTNTKETTKEVTSGEDLKYYNKFIEAMNKIQEAGDGINKNYISSVPEPNSITKNSLIIPITFSMSVSTMERTIKDYKRSYLDGGELSKLDASSDMKNEIGNDFKNLLSAMEDYYPVAKKVSDYYSNYEYKNDLPKAKGYDEEMKSAYEKYKTAFKTFSGDLKKYKPKRDIRDPGTISNPDERASQIMLNAYGNILDAAEEFYESYDGLNYKGDYSAAMKKFDEFEKKFYDNRHDVLNGDFTDKTKYMKYNFEDYFSKTCEDFIDAGKKFFDKATASKNENDYREIYNDVIRNYNYMIDSYNNSINSINMVRSWE